MHYVLGVDNNIIVSGEAILSAEIVEKLWAVVALPQTPLGQSLFSINQTKTKTTVKIKR